eukprot:621507-Prymnesium_polylepis.1
MTEAGLAQEDTTRPRKTESRAVPPLASRSRHLVPWTSLRTARIQRWRSSSDSAAKTKTVCLPACTASDHGEWSRRVIGGGGGSAQREME